MHGHDMNPISGGLDEVKARLLAALPAEEAPLVAWPWICGQRVAANARAVSFTDEVLTVAVADDAWRRELTGMAASYVGRLNQILPAGTKVVRIHFEKA